LWGGSEAYKKVPYIAWDNICIPKRNGGLGVKNIGLWNMACIAKLVWDIANKKDTLWVQWIHGRYIKARGWWEYSIRSDASWYWKKLLKVRDRFRTYPKADYKIQEGYAWLLNVPLSPKWTNITWTRISIPRHSLTVWMFMHQRLPILERQGKHTQLPSVECSMCQQSSETQDHLFFECSYAKNIWEKFLNDWHVDIERTGLEVFVNSLTKLKMPRRLKALFYAMTNAVIYNIWLVRNRKLYSNMDYPVDEVLKEIKRQIVLRILHLNQYSQKYTSCLDFLLHKV